MATVALKGGASECWSLFWVAKETTVARRQLEGEVGVQGWAWGPAPRLNLEGQGGAPPPTPGAPGTLRRGWASWGRGSAGVGRGPGVGVPVWGPRRRFRVAARPSHAPGVALGPRGAGGSGHRGPAWAAAVAWSLGAGPVLFPPPLDPRGRVFASSRGLSQRFMRVTRPLPFLQELCGRGLPAACVERPAAGSGPAPASAGLLLC